MRRSLNEMPWGRRGFVAVVVAAAVTLAGCTGAGQNAGNTNFVSGDGTITVLDVASRQPPVALAGTTLDGSRLDIASYRGSILVLNVWYSTCAPCRREAPDLEAVWQAERSRQVQFVGINVKETDPAGALAFQRQFGITYPSLNDAGGSLLLGLRGAVAPNAIPSTLVLDREGRIAARMSGLTTKATLTALIESVRSGTPFVTGRTPSGGASS